MTVLRVFLLLLPIGSAIGQDIVLFDKNTPHEFILEEHYRLVKAAMNTTVDPCEDFYEYACGNWSNVSEEYSYNTGALEQLSSRVSAATQDMFKIGYKSSPENDYERNSSETVHFQNEIKARNYYESCMNKTLLDEIGTKPVLDLLETFEGWPISDSYPPTDSYDWLNLTGHLHRYGLEYIFGTKLDVDILNPSNNVIYLYPSKPLFENKIMNILFSDVTYEELQNVLGENVLTKKLFKKLMKLEKSLSKYYKEFDIIDAKTMSVRKITRKVPQVNWPRFFTIALNETITPSHKVTVVSLKYFVKAGQLIARTPSRMLTNFILMRFTHDLLHFLNPDYVFRLYSVSSILSSQLESLEVRHVLCSTYTLVHFENTVLGMFVRQYFNSDSKQYATELIEDIRMEFSEFINNTDWIEESTKKAAIDKLNAISLMVGYPDNLLEMEMDLPDMKTDSYFENSIKLLLYERNQLTPLDYRLLGIKLFEAYAGYITLKGRPGYALFTAGVLQPPYFHISFPKWANYGSIGFISGHELTHAFSKNDIKNNQDEDVQWWDTESFNEFNLRKVCYYSQYSSFKFAGILQRFAAIMTLDENMADNGGLTFSYNAYLTWLDRNRDSIEHGINEYFNLSGKQLFFVSFAQSFCSSADESQMGIENAFGNHAPEKFRIIGSLANSNGFSEAYTCSIGSPMNPVEKCDFN